MRSNYEVLKIEIVKISSADIITTSGGGNAVLPDDEF